MNLKTSLFDKSIIKSDFKRFWWVMAVFMLLLALFVLPDAVENYGYPNSFADEFYFNTDKGALAFVFAFFLSGMLFSYLHKGSAVSSLHGLPVTRKSQYASHILVGSLLLFIPVFISGIVIFIESVCLNSGEIFALKYALKYMYVCGVYAAVAFMFTTLTVMISGNTIAAYIFSAAFMILPAFVISMIEVILNSNLYGYSNTEWYELYSKIYLSFEQIWGKESLLYIIIIAVLVVVTYFLYKNRKLENYDEIVAFKFLRPVFMYTVAVCFGLFGDMLVVSIWNVNTLFLGTLPLGITALTAAFMLNRKSFSVKGLLKPVCIFVIAVGIVKLCFVLDITGYERRVPDIEDIVSIEPYNDIAGRYDDVSYSNGSYLDNDYYREYRGNIELTDKEDIENIVNLHKSIISNRKIERNKNHYEDMDNPIDFNFKYNLKNGNTIERTYWVEESYYKDYLVRYYENDVYKKMRFPLINNVEKHINYVSYKGLYGQVVLQNIDYEKLYEAVKSDIDNLRYEDIAYINKSYDNNNSLSINYGLQIEKNGEVYDYAGSMDIELNKCFKNTNALIRDALSKAERITVDDIDGVYMTVRKYQDYKADVENFNITDDNKSKEIFTALEDMEYADNTESNSDVIDITMSFTCNGKQVVYCSYDKPYNEYPPVVREYLE